MRTAAAVLAIVLAAAPTAAWAGLQYRVQIEAPAELARILEQGLNLRRWQNDPDMSAERLRRLADEAVREAREAAATRGYFSAAVSVSVLEGAEPWTVVLRVEPGERTLVGEIDIRVSGPAAQDASAQRVIKRMRDRWFLRRGEPFRQADWEQAKRQALRELSAWRYAAAHIADSRALIDPELQRASLSVEIASGPPFRFGPVLVSGNRRYPDAAVENLSPVRPGDDYDHEKVVQYQRRLLETGYFASVQADIDAHPEAADASPLRIAVIEANSQHVETGIGYSTDAGARFELNYSNQDVFDSAWRFRSGLRLDQKIQSLQFDLDSPPRPRAHWNNFFARAKQGDIQNETTRELAFGWAHNFGFEATPSALILSAHFEEQRVAGDVTDNRHALYLGHRRSFRRTDSLVAPRSGILASAEVGGAPPGVSTRQFLRGTASASLFFPFGRNGDLLLRGQAGGVAAKTREGIPSSFLFRTGGDQTVRGYPFDSLGVRQGEAIVGGRRLLVGSVEYTQWLGENWGVAAFVDAGNAWDQGIRFDPALGYGVGARFRTPIGPIRADLAYGEEIGSLRLHFSVGYTF